MPEITALPPLNIDPSSYPFSFWKGENDREMDLGLGFYHKLPLFVPFKKGNKPLR